MLILQVLRLRWQQAQFAAYSFGRGLSPFGHTDRMLAWSLRGGQRPHGGKEAHTYHLRRLLLPAGGSLCAPRECAVPHVSSHESRLARTTTAAAPGASRARARSGRTGCLDCPREQPGTAEHTRAGHALEADRLRRHRRLRDPHRSLQSQAGGGQLRLLLGEDLAAGPHPPVRRDRLRSRLPVRAASRSPEAASVSVSLGAA